MGFKLSMKVVGNYPDGSNINLDKDRLYKYELEGDGSMKIFGRNSPIILKYWDEKGEQ